MTSDLLPPSATTAERALAQSAAGYGDLPVILRKLWHPDTCPVSLLPYLAYSFSVDDWDEQWSEAIKRQVVTDALYQHRIKGSLKAVENAIAGFGARASISEWWQQTPPGEPHTFGVTISAQDNERQLPVYELTGEQAVYTCAAVPITTSRVYRVRFKVRQTADNDEAKVYAGVATLDANFDNLTGGAGPHRYCCVNTQQLTTNDSWQVFEGEITGTGDNHNQFRPGTKYVRPMFIVNASAGTGTAQIAELELWDLFENRQLIANPRFQQGLQGWSQAYVGEQVPENALGTLTTAAFRPDADLQTSIVEAIQRAKPVRSHFDLTVGTVHAAAVSLQTHLQITVMHRGNWA